MRLSPRKDKYYMNNEVVRVLVTSPLGVGGVTNMMIHIQEHLDRSKINFDYLVFHDRHEPMEDRVLSEEFGELMKFGKSAREIILKSYIIMRIVQQI